MKSFFKYTGGKTRELKKIRPYIPKSVGNVIEPFAGSCAVAFDVELPAVVGDLNEDVINLLNVAKSKELFPKLMDLVSNTNIDLNKSDTNTEHLEKLYYSLRDDEWKNTDPLIKAYRFLVLRQLCFSGMTRVNVKTGKSNVPFGWYKIFQTRLNQHHHNLLQNWDIACRDWQETASMANRDSWVFFDPPYLERNSTYEVNSDAGTSEKIHQQIYTMCKKLSSQGIPWLVVHSDCDLYRDLYTAENITHEQMFYSQNFKGNGVKNARIGHLYISPKQ